MVSMLASSAVDHGFERRSGQTKDYKIGNCCYYIELELEWVSDCCLTPTQQFFSYIMARKSWFSMRWWILCWKLGMVSTFHFLSRNNTCSKKIRSWWITGCFTDKTLMGSFGHNHKVVGFIYIQGSCYWASVASFLVKETTVTWRKSDLV
jgi:hypothetical protein